MAMYSSPADGIKEFEIAIDAVRGLQARYPQRVEFTELLVELLGSYSNTLNLVGRKAEAERQTLTAINVANQFADRFPEESPFLWSGSLSSQIGDYSQAVVALGAAAENYRILMDQHPERPRHRADLATCLKRLAYAHVRNGDYGSAIEHCKESIAIVEALANESPEIAAYHSKVERRYRLLARLHLDLGELENAAQAMRRELASALILRESFPSFPRASGQIISTHTRLANILLDIDPPQLDAAAAELKNGIELCRQPESTPIQVPLLCQLARVFARQQAIALAEESVREASNAIDAFSGWLGENSKPQHHASILRWNVANAYWELGDHDQANQIAHKLTEEPRTEACLKDPAWLFNHAWHLANFPNATQAQVANALELAKSAWRQFPNDPSAWHMLGVTQYRAQEFEQAAASLKKSLELRPSSTAFNHLFLAMAELQQGDVEKAKKNFEVGSRSLLSATPFRFMEYRDIREEAAEMLRRYDH